MPFRACLSSFRACCPNGFGAKWLKFISYFAFCQQAGNLTIRLIYTIIHACVLRVRTVKEIIVDEASPKISVEYFDNATVVFLSEENILRERDITAIESSVMPLIEKTDGVNLIINFRNVKFLTSSALGLLIRIKKKAYENNGKILLCTIDPKIYQIFAITRLDKVFAIYDTQVQALESLE